MCAGQGKEREIACGLAQGRGYRFGQARLWGYAASIGSALTETRGKARVRNKTAERAARARDLSLKEFLLLHDSDGEKVQRTLTASVCSTHRHSTLLIHASWRQLTSSLRTVPLVQSGERVWRGRGRYASASGGAPQAHVHTRPIEHLYLTNALLGHSWETWTWKRGCRTRWRRRGA